MGQDTKLERRKEAIKDLLRRLHEGQTVDQVKKDFQEAFDGVSATEISEAEQALVDEGLAVEEIQKLCDVHAAVFKGSIEEIHAPKDVSKIEGHPAYVFTEENRALEKLIKAIRPDIKAFSEGSKDAGEILGSIEKLWEIDKHYQRKENLFFPILERYGITAPPKVMWAVDDDIRQKIKNARSLAEAANPGFVGVLEEALDDVGEMIFKEENILLPMMVDSFDQKDWQEIAQGSDELGYCLIDKPADWGIPSGQVKRAKEASLEGDVVLPSGTLSVEELTHLLNTLPIDMTFVGKDDTVRYFSESAERIFPRTRAVIGREVKNCHPPASVHVVEQVVEDLRSGKKTHEDFWISMGDKYILIRYFAVRNSEGEYLGVLEVSQDIGPLQKITGEKRLMS